MESAKTTQDGKTTTTAKVIPDIVNAKGHDEVTPSANAQPAIGKSPQTQNAAHDQAKAKTPISQTQLSAPDVAHKPQKEGVPTNPQPTAGAPDVTQGQAHDQDPGESPETPPGGAATSSTPADGAPELARPRNALLEGSRYAITVYLWKGTEGGQEAKGSILSQTLQKSILAAAPGKYAGDVTMAQMRKLAPGVYNHPIIRRP